jgi:organic hydroperoxide reductase OsmC/OhrA
MTEHGYSSRIAWTGNRGDGTIRYRGYDRTWDIITPGKPIISCSNDPLLGGDPALPNPEDLLLSALAACHMLWYLHYASADGIVVTAYQDTPIGIGETAPNGAGRFLKATLKPHITLAAGSDLAAADAIHGRIHAVCFLARSVNFPISCEAAYATA